MNKHHDNKMEYRADANEQQRLAIAGGILAVVAALYAAHTDGHSLWELTRGLAIFPGVLAFAYLILTRAALKCKQPGLFGQMNIAGSIRQWFFDTAINLFWCGFILNLAFFVATVAGWDGKQMEGKFFIGLAASTLLWVLVFAWNLYAQKSHTPKHWSAK